MKQYRSNVERQEWLYSMMKSRELMRRRRIAAGKVSPVAKPIPDNSEPWLPGGVKCVADAFWISDQIAAAARQWKIKLPPQD